MGAFPKRFCFENENENEIFENGVGNVFEIVFGYVSVKIGLGIRKE